MATPILKLKKDAVSAGMDKDKARSAHRAELEAFIANKSKRTAPAKKGAVKKSTTKATTTRKPAAPARKAPVRKTAATKPAAKKPVPAKAPAARSAAKRPATKANANGNGNGGRHSIATLDFSATDGWNPRPGSQVEVIFRTLKKFRGDVSKTFDALLPRIDEFVSKSKRDGSRRTKDEKQSMLRYRISRTKFDFAVKTNQHESATDRVEYGTGQYATTRAKKATPARRTAAKPAARRTSSATTRKTAKPAAKKTAARRR
jgi:hypothetical protein